MVSMTSLQFHTRGGTPHPEGSTYDADESEVENLTAQRLAIVTPAKATGRAAPAARASSPVAPMTTTNKAPTARQTLNRTLKAKAKATPRPKAKAKTKGRRK